MSLHDLLVSTETRILQEFGTVEAAISRGERPDPRSVARLRELISEVPNARDDFLGSLASCGEPAELSDPRLPLTSIGRVPTPLATLDEATRYAVCEDALVALRKAEDPPLLAAAIACAASLPNRRDHWTFELNRLTEAWRQKVQELAL